MIVVSGHQPLYLPWLGFIHKLALADKFIFMDDVQLLDRDFNQRNRILSPNGKVLWLSVPLARKKSASKKLCDIRIATDGANKNWQKDHLLSLRCCYGKTDFFNQYFEFFKWLYLENSWQMLSDLNLTILKQIMAWFKLTSEIIIASKQKFKEKKSDLLLEHAMRFNADILLTGENGVNYARMSDFENNGIYLEHQKYIHPLYQQGRFYGITHLSFIDLLFCYGDDAREILMRGNLTREELWKKISFPSI